MNKQRFSIQEFTKEFPDNDSCLRFLFRSLFPNPTCPRCKRVNKYHQQADSSHFVCQCGGHQISPKKNTIFFKSDTDLYKWFYAMYLFSVSKNGVAVKELERELKVTYKTAWRIAFQIRQLMKQKGSLFGGTVEGDETYVGGKRRGKRGRGAAGKTPVFGLIERPGRVRAMVVPNTKGATLLPIIQSSVKRGSTMMTDEYLSYSRVKKLGYKHQTVHHAAKEYVREKVHTNSIEGFWSQLKRSIDGTHHAVSPLMLQNYVDEHVWRWNLRGEPAPLFYRLLSEVSA